MSLRFFDACDNRPQRIIRVTRAWRSHLTAKERRIGCSTLFDMRGNWFADEMVGRAATSVELLPSQANGVEAMAWLGKSECALFRHIWRRSPASPSASSYRRVPSHRKTRQRKRNELLETSASGAGTRSKADGADVKSVDVQGTAELVAPPAMEAGAHDVLCNASSA